MFVNSDFSDLLRLFNVNQVRYLVIGGYALMQYAEPRYTKDLDLWISADATNAQAVYLALREFGAPLADLTAADFAQEGYFYQSSLMVSYKPQAGQTKIPDYRNTKFQLCNPLH